MSSGHRVFLIAILFISFDLSAATYYSRITGNWSTAATWSTAGCGGVAAASAPGIGDDVIICAGNTVTMDGNAGNCLSLTIQGTAHWTLARTTNVGVGGLLISGGVISGTATGMLNVAGNFSVPLGSSAAIGRSTITISGTTTIDGSLTFNNATGTKTFTDIIVNTSGTWVATVAVPVIIHGDVNTSGSFNCNSGTYALSGNLSVNAGTTSYEGSVGGALFIAGGAVMDLLSGTLTVTGASTINGTLNISTATGTKTLGDITISNTGVWNCSLVEAFTISGNVSFNGTFTPNTGTYTFSGTDKTFSGTVSIPRVSVTGTYTNTGTLSVTTLLSGTGTLTQDVGSTLNIRGTPTITNLIATAVPNTVNYNGIANQTIKATSYCDLLVNSTAGTVAFGATTVNNNFTIATGTVSIGAVTMSVAGTTSISGRLNITSTTGTKTFNDITINSIGTWNSTVGESFTINGNLLNNNTFTANTGVYTLAGTAKAIAGTLNIPSISVTGSYVNDGTLTTSTALRGTGSFSQGAAGILNIGATAANFSVITFNASVSGNTVNYNRAGVQSVRVPSDGSYHHLILAGSGNKTLLGIMDINGNITISSVLVANSFNMTLAGNWLNIGNFTPGTNTVMLDGSTQSIAKSGGEVFNHLAISGSGIKTLGSAITTNGNLTINSILDISTSNYGVAVRGNWINNGTFIYRTGTVTFSGGTAQTIGGTVITDFYNLTQSNTAGVSLAQHQNLIRVLTVSAGTFTTTGFNFTLISNASGTASIAAIPGVANIADNVIMQRYSGTGPTDWRFLASPVAGTTIADWADDFPTSGFTGSTDPGNSFVSIYSYDETQAGDLNTYGYVAADNVTNSISNGKGFWVYLGPTPVTFEVTGPPNKFSQSLPVTYVNSGDITSDGWNLVRNPYPSAIDWNSASWTKNNLDNAIYIYNSNTGSYASYVAGLGVNGGSNIIPSSQSFWVKANAASPVLTTVENIKTSSDAIFMKTAESPNTSSYPMAFTDFSIPQNTNETMNSIRLTAGRNGKEDETYIRFTSDASNDFDNKYDAWKLQNLSTELPNISSVINDTTDLAINSMSNLTTDLSVKIRLTVPFTGTYYIRRDSILMLPMSACVFLEDKLTGTFTDFRANISYSFTITDTTQVSRFVLHIYAPVSKKAVKTRCSNDSSGMAIAKGVGVGPWNYVWKNPLGTVLKTTANSYAADTLFNLSAGVYTIEVSGSVCGIVSDTITISSSSALQMSVDYSHVTCNGLSDGTASVTISGGMTPYTYLWTHGFTTPAVNNLSPGNYSVSVTDAAGCSQTQTIIISQPAVLVAGFTVSADTLDLSSNNSVLFTDTSSGAMTYNWDFGDSILSDTTRNPIHYYSLSGTYSVTLVVSNGTCLDTCYARIVVLDSLVIVTEVPEPEPSGNNSVQVTYENGEIFLVLDLPVKKDVSIGVYNMLGERIHMQKVKQAMQNKVKLYNADFSSGVYIAVVNIDNAVISKKIVLREK